jgi:putative CocE/NonD family hydrolase
VRFKLILLYYCIFWVTTQLSALEPDSLRSSYIRSTYKKFEYQIPMRDGVKLFTAVYLPYDDSKEYPILLVRTPYGVAPYGANVYKEKLGPHFAYEKEGFIFVFQDVRGKYMSEGNFVNMRPHLENKPSKTDIDESTDTYDTIEWLLKNIKNHNGRVGQWGVSYPGFYCSAGMINSHPALKAVSPQAPIADWFWDDVHRHGAFNLNLTFNFFSSFGKKRAGPYTESPASFDHKIPDAYQFFLDLGPLKNANLFYLNGEINFWNSIIQHPNYDEFWQARNILPHLKNIKAAVMIVGGWFDTEDLYGPLKTYQSVEAQNPGIYNMLVMGPWSHGGWYDSNGSQLGDADFGFKTATWFQENIDLKFFKNFLKADESGKIDFPEAFIFETGANRWREFEKWPPKSVRRTSLFLHPSGKLDFNPPGEGEAIFAEYPSDPYKPVPYTKEITNQWAKNYMTEDQRFASQRPDVLVFQTDKLTQDITIAGPLKAKLFVSITGTDADFIVKLIDVFPNEIPSVEKNSKKWKQGAQQMLIRGEPFRGRFRESYQYPEPFIPQKIYHINYELQDVCHTFKRDHKIMIQVQSSWFPFIDRNPQKFVENIFDAQESDFIKAMHRIYFSKDYPSQIQVGIYE